MRCSSAAGVLAQDAINMTAHSYTSMGAYLYVLYSEALPQEAAEFVCSAVGGHLASAHSQVENQALVDLCNAQDTTLRCWIGLMATTGSTSSNVSNSHAWIDGTDFEYLDWLPDQPNGDDTCTSLRKAAPNDSSASAWQSSACTNQLSFLCKVNSTVAAQLDLLANITTSPPVSPAPPAYQYPSTTMMLNNNTYLLYEQAANFSAASVMCGSVGGYLASAHNTLESQLLQDLCAASIAGSCWLGLHSTTSNGTYTWVDGSTIDWLPAQGLATEAGCVHVYVPASNTSTPESWQTTDCAVQHSFLCKVASTAASHLNLYGISPSRAPSTSPDITNPISSMVLNNNTYLLYEHAANFSTASVMCGSVGGTLASAHSTLESQLLQDLCRYATIPNCWLGLAGTPAGNYSWPDGTPVDFLAWQEAHPIPGDDCTYLAAGQSGNTTGSSTQAWRSSSCGEQLAFICKVDSTAATQLNLYGISPSPSPVVPPSSPSSTLPTKNMVLNNSIYLLYEQAADFADATSMCQSVGGHLASAHSAVESYLLQDLCAASYAGSCWLGLLADAASNGTYSWVDGSTMDWFPTNTLNESGPCVHVQLPITNWSTIWQGGSCNTQRSFMCRVDSTAASQLNLYGASPSPQQSPSSGSSLPITSTMLNNNTYILYSKEVNFSTADATCASLGGNLASAHSSLENQLLMDLCSNYAPSAACWLGLYDTQASNYTWVDGSAVDFTAWDSLDSAVSQGCGFITAGALSPANATNSWGSVLCDQGMPFWCKLDSTAASLLNLHGSPSIPTYPSPAPWSPAPHSPPPPSYTMVLNNNTYMLYELPANFSAAEQQCTAVGGQLASAHNPLENQVLLELCGQAYMGDCWFGLLPGGHNDSSYSWTDGTAADFFTWLPNYPGEFDQSACGYIAAKTPGSNSTSLWGVAVCDYPLAFVCKVDSSATSELQLHSNVSAAVDVKVLNASCTTASQAGKHSLWQLVQIVRVDVQCAGHKAGCARIVDC
jgi:hypothetical protein